MPIRIYTNAPARQLMDDRPFGFAAWTDGSHLGEVYAIVYLVNVLALGVMLQFGIPEWLGGLILLLPSAILSYVLNRQFVFPP